MELEQYIYISAALGKMCDGLRSIVLAPLNVEIVRAGPSRVLMNASSGRSYTVRQGCPDDQRYPGTRL
jgi:hypothetical protein